MVDARAQLLAHEIGQTLKNPASRAGLSFQSLLQGVVNQDSHLYEGKWTLAELKAQCCELQAKKLLIISSDGVVNLAVSIEDYETAIFG